MKWYLKVLLGILGIALFCLLLDLTYFICKYETLYDATHTSLYNDLYLPDSFLTSDPKLLIEIKDREFQGLEHVKSKKIVLSVLCRNNLGHLSKFRERMEKILDKFQDYKIVIFENDSTDGTRTWLVKWQRSNPQHVVLLKCCDDNIENPIALEEDCQLKLDLMYNLGPISSNRFEKMAMFRNQYLDYIKKNLQDYDYMCVMDVDLKGGFSQAGFWSAFSYKAEQAGNPNKYDWDALFANGMINVPGLLGLRWGFYDMLAFVPSSDEADDRTNWTEKTYYQLFFNSFVNPLSESNISNEMQVGRNPFPVKSAFNGMALYDLRCLKNNNNNNDTSIKYEPSTCEHIGLHIQMSKQGFNKFYVLPEWLLLPSFQGPSGNATSVLLNS